MVYGIGFSDGDDCQKTIKRKTTKEYDTWRGIMRRCSHRETDKKKFAEYQDVVVSEEWLHFSNFLKWLKEQPNYDKWKSGGKDWAIDKDIIKKGNRVYCSENCCLVPHNINELFTNRKNYRGKTKAPGVYYANWIDKYRACVRDPLLCKRVYLGSYETVEEAFSAYKKAKETIIKSIAEIEYALGNISKKCYDGMLKYEIQITD